MEPARRSSSLPPPEQPNPFWSDRVQDDHQLEQHRPRELAGMAAINEPVPIDDDLGKSLHPGSSGLVKGEDATSFRTPADDQHAPSEKPQPVELDEKEMDDAGPPIADGVSGKRQERAWRRRNLVDEKRAVGDQGVPVEKPGKKLEDELGDQMLLHFQQEAARLQRGNFSR